MSNVHALLFEGFAAHKLVMRSSHRWDHGTPYSPLPQHFHFSFLSIFVNSRRQNRYPTAVPSLAWIRPALRQLVQRSARVSVATEWDYWYSRSVLTTNNRNSCTDLPLQNALQVSLLHRSRAAADDIFIHVPFIDTLFLQICGCGVSHLGGQ
jgi:hypothetical protein